MSSSGGWLGNSKLDATKRAINEQTYFFMNIPRASITQRTATIATFAESAKFLGQVLARNLCKKFVLVVAPDNINLVDGDLVQPGLDQPPNGVECPGRVDDVEFAHGLGITVLTDR